MDGATSAPAPATAPGEPAGPVHMVGGPATTWTTVNFAEAIQGVQKPLSWSMWSLSMETSVRLAFGAIGAFSAAEAAVPLAPDDRMSGIFYGRAAGNVDVFRLVADRLPGSSGDAIEEKLFGVTLTGPPARKPLAAYARYPVVAVKFPRAARRAVRELPAVLEEYRGWWAQAVLRRPPSDLVAAQALLADAARRFIHVGELHTVTTFLASGLLDALGALSERATGDTALVADLATGYGAMEETQLIEDLWHAAAGRRSVDEVLARHGFHGPDEGDLSSRVWREDPAPLESLLRGFARNEVADPRGRERAQAERRRQAEERLIAGLPRLRQPGPRLTLRLAATFIPQREIGKAAFLIALDAARCAARVAGRELERTGVLIDAEDVFFLTYDELQATPTAAIRATVEERRAAHDRYRGLDIPPRWTGAPEAVALPAADSAPAAPSTVTQLQGIGVVGERVTGRARVVMDPLEVDLEDGDILVCRTTDPSWTPLFLLADALVIDTGGAMSHGAIVARELGVTCVINTVTGTRDIPDGAQITVDGASGLVQIIR